MTQVDREPRTSAITFVAVFAHNEERNIERCLGSLHAAGCPQSATVAVLVNGSTDRTASIVTQYAKTRETVKLILISLGDKANAWNEFVHTHAPSEGIVVFVDGDVVAAPGSIAALARALSENSTALIASAVPGSGRNRQAQVDSVLKEHGVQGNLYAVRAQFLQKIRSAGVRMPVGFVREDGLIGALAKWDLDPLGAPWNDTRVVPVRESRFLFDSIPMWSVRGWRQYFRRRVRYSLGHFENAMLGQVLKSAGPTAIPATVTELYKIFPEPIVTWRGLNTFFDWIAVRRITARRAASE